MAHYTKKKKSINEFQRKLKTIYNVFLSVRHRAVDCCVTPLRADARCRSLTPRSNPSSSRLFLQTEACFSQSVACYSCPSSGPSLVGQGALAGRGDVSHGQSL